MFCACPKNGVHKKLVHIFFHNNFPLESIFVKFPNPVHNDLTVFISVSAKNVLLKLTYQALNKYGNFQIYARETLVHQKLHHVVSHNYLI